MKQSSIQPVCTTTSPSVQPARPIGLPALYPSLGTQRRSITVVQSRSFNSTCLRHVVFGIIFLIYFVRLINFVPTHLFTHLSTHLFILTILTSINQSFSPRWKPTLLIYMYSLLVPCSLHELLDWTCVQLYSPSHGTRKKINKLHIK